MIELVYVCHRCNLAIEATRPECDAFYSMRCTECGDAMQPHTQKALLESWPGPRFPDPPKAA